MALNYGTSSIPSDKYTVQSGGTVQVSAAFEASVTVVGGMDTANGSASTGTVVEVTDVPDAQTKFGQNSELHEAVKMLFNNGAETVHALPVAETTVTESGVGDSGTLANVPLFDPNVNTEHSIDAVDTSGTNPTTQISYKDPVPTPTTSDTMNVNPVTGSFAFDAVADGQYDVTYTYGDYTSSELQKAVDEDDRIVVVLTENTSVAADLVTEVEAKDDNFVFQHAVAGAVPVDDLNDVGGFTSNYSDSLDSERLTLVSPSRGFIDEAETDVERTMSAVAGYLAGLPLGLSSTNDSLGVLQALRADYTFSQAKDMIDAQVMPLLDYPPVTIVKDMTTSTTQRFERVYAMQVVDEVTELGHEISKAFVGEQQTVNERNQLERSLRNMLRSLEDDVPPKLVDWTVTVEQDSSNDNHTNVSMGIQVVGVMDLIDVTLTVGDIVRNQNS